MAFYAVLMPIIISCATPSAQLPPEPPRFVYENDKPVDVSTANSLWNDDENIFMDRKARKLNDIVLIKIVESLSGSGTADTKTSRSSSGDYGLDELFGMKTDFNLQDKSLLKDFYNDEPPNDKFIPSVKGSAQSDFSGKGDTNREGDLVATVTARVVEVMPNGNLVLAARKEMTINEEKQILVFSGIARPDDIEADNSILSVKVADARVYYVGDGVIQDKQKPGWLVRALDKVWPF